MKRTFSLISLAFAFASAALAQTPPAPVISPEVHADNRVTFRFRAPNAKEVALALEWRVRNSPGCCPAFLSAAKAPGVATIWPNSKAGCLLSCCIGKTPFVGFVFCFLEAPQRAVH